MLLRERRIGEAVSRKLLGRRHIGSQDGDGRRAVAEYILHSPFSLEKLRYHATTGMVIYRSKMHPVLRRNFEVFSACDGLAALTAYIPNAGDHLARYSGWYSNVSQGKRREAGGEDLSRVEALSGVLPSTAKRAWARRSAELAEASSSRCTKSIRSCVPDPPDPCASVRS